MLNKSELGKAIDKAIKMKLESGGARTKAEIARHFGIQPPSLVDWVKKGSIAKEKLPELWRYFSDVVDWRHWGMTQGEWPSELSNQHCQNEKDISNLDTRLSPSGNTNAPKIGAESAPDDQGGKMPKLASVSTLKPNLDYVRFEIYDIRMSAGPGAAQIERADVVEYLPVLRTWAQENLGTANQDRIKLVTCSGISMQPTIDDGALMFVDIKVREFRGDGLYCLAWNKDLIVKRLIADVIGGTLRIVSDNPDKDNYRDVIVRPEEMDQITILGQVKRWFKTCKP